MDQWRFKGGKSHTHPFRPTGEADSVWDHFRDL